MHLINLCRQGVSCSSSWHSGYHCEGVVVGARATSSRAHASASCHDPAAVHLDPTATRFILDGVQPDFETRRARVVIVASPKPKTVKVRNFFHTAVPLQCKAAHGWGRLQIRHIHSCVHPQANIQGCGAHICCCPTFTLQQKSDKEVQQTTLIMPLWSEGANPDGHGLGLLCRRVLIPSVLCRAGLPADCASSLTHAHGRSSFFLSFFLGLLGAEIKAVGCSALPQRKG